MTRSKNMEHMDMIIDSYINLDAISKSILFGGENIKLLEKGDKIIA